MSLGEGVVGAPRPQNAGPRPRRTKKIQVRMTKRGPLKRMTGTLSENPESLKHLDLFEGAKCSQSEVFC